jgi:hypothetical protein
MSNLSERDVSDDSDWARAAKTGLVMKYFVLKPRGDDNYAIASRRALLAYADYIEIENHQLAADLRAWVEREYLAAMEQEHERRVHSES